MTVSPHPATRRGNEPEEGGLEVFTLTASTRDWCNRPVEGVELRVTSSPYPDVALGVVYAPGVVGYTNAEGEATIELLSAPGLIYTLAPSGPFPGCRFEAASEGENVNLADIVTAHDPGDSLTGLELVLARLKALETGSEAISVPDMGEYVDELLA